MFGAVVFCAVLAEVKRWDPGRLRRCSGWRTLTGLGVGVRGVVVGLGWGELLRAWAGWGLDFGWGGS